MNPLVLSEFPKAPARDAERRSISQKLQAARAVTRRTMYAVHTLFTVYYKKPADAQWRLWGNVPEGALEEHLSAVRLRGYDFVVNDDDGRQVREGKAICR